MFQFPGFPLIHYVFMYEYARSSCVGFPIQKSAGQWIFAPYRSLSQLITSFVGSQCQGIRPVPYLAWPFVPTSCSVMMRSVLFLRFLLKSVNLFFSMIYGLMCFWYAVFKVHSYLHLDIRYLIDLITKFLLSSCDEHPWDSDPSAGTLHCYLCPWRAASQPCPSIYILKPSQVCFL